MQLTTVRRTRGNPWLKVVGGLLLALLLYALIVPLIVSADPNAQDLGDRLIAPSWDLGDSHVLGTDDLGRDIWLRLAYGLRTSFSVGLAVVAIGMTIGVGLGLVAGYFGRMWDVIIMRAADIQLSVPVLLVAMLLVAVGGGGAAIVIVVLGLSSWMVFARVTRSAVLGLKESEFIAATSAVGVRPLRMLFVHVLPNVFGTILVTATFELATAMLNEAGLSFLGFGIESPGVSLGTMMSVGLQYIATHWWLGALPGIALSLTVLASNLVATWLRESMSRTVSTPRR